MIYPQNMAAALRRFEPAATPPDDGESGGDLTPDDDTDCAPEGLSCEAWHAQYEGTEAVDDAADAPLSDYLVAAVAGLIVRVRRLEAGANEANNAAQVERLAREEFGRRLDAQDKAIAQLQADLKAWGRRIDAVHTLLACDVRAIDEAAATAREVA